MKRGLLIFGAGYLIGATVVNLNYLHRLGVPMFKTVNSPEYPEIRAAAEARAKARVAESMQGLADAIRAAVQQEQAPEQEQPTEASSEKQFKTIIRNENLDS